jgi:anti-sigma B factor antagonist
MALRIRIEERHSFAKTLHLAGRLDDETAPDLDSALDEALEAPLKVLVFDLGGLEYTSSAGLRAFMRAQKSMSQHAGQVLFLNVQPTVQKVFDIAKATDFAKVFRNVKELDEYLDAMQKKVREESP